MSYLTHFTGCLWGFPHGPPGSDGKVSAYNAGDWVQSLGREDPLQKGVLTHSSILAWKIPWMEEPGRLQSMGSQRVGHDWVTSLSHGTSGKEHACQCRRHKRCGFHLLSQEDPLEECMAVFLPGESCGQRSLASYSQWGQKESDTTEATWHTWCMLFLLDLTVVQSFSCVPLFFFLRPHGPQHVRLPCPSPSPGVCSNLCPLSQWCHPTISSSVTLFSSCLQSFPASGSFPMSQLFPSGRRSIGASASASVLPMNIQDWFPLELTGLISFLSKGLSRLFSSTMVQKHHFLGPQPFLWSNSHIHTWPLEKP